MGRKTGLMGVLALLGCLLAGACGGGESPSTRTSAVPAAGDSAAQTTRTGAAAETDGKTPGAGHTLVIVSPHDEAIKRELGDGFKVWYTRVHPDQPAVEIEWQNRGGSVDINKYLASAYSALGDKRDQGVGIDLYFGGGPPAHQQLKDNDLSAAVQLEAGVESSVPEKLAGVNLRDPDKRWFGVVLSSFGMIFNKPGLKSKGLTEPQTWSDLTDPKYYNTLILADPAKSGSARVCYEVILQKYGWDAGWAILMQIAGNTREFAAGSDAVPREVGQGSAIAGMCVDYYAYSQIGQTGADVIGYVNPVNATAVTPDPIGMLRGAPHAELAREFITYTLSPEAQGLFGLKQGAPGGPVHASLYRMPILPAFYERNTTETRVVAGNPYTATTTFNINEELSRRRSPLIGPLFTAAFLSNREQLQAAWQAVINKPELMAHFTAVPFSAEEALKLAAQHGGNQREAIQLERQWQEQFRTRYESIVNAAR